jgi:hypothetical protein
LQQSWRGCRRWRPRQKLLLLLLEGQLLLYGWLLVLLRLQPLQLLDHFWGLA